MDRPHTYGANPMDSIERDEQGQPLESFEAGPSEAPSNAQPSLLELMANQYHALQGGQERGQLAMSGIMVNYNQSPERTLADNFAFEGELNPREYTHIAGPHLLQIMSPVMLQRVSKRNDADEPNVEAQEADEEANMRHRSKDNKGKSTASHARPSQASGKLAAFLPRFH